MQIKFPPASSQISASAPSRSRRKGSIFVEYLLLLTIVGIGGLVGIAEVRSALHNELIQLAAAINAITP